MKTIGSYDETKCVEDTCVALSSPSPECFPRIALTSVAVNIIPPHLYESMVHTYFEVLGNRY